MGFVSWIGFDCRLWLGLRVDAGEPSEPDRRRPATAEPSRRRRQPVPVSSFLFDFVSFAFLLSSQVWSATGFLPEWVLGGFSGFC